MDAVKYLKTKGKMTENCINMTCDNCPLSYNDNGLNLGCSTLEKLYPEKAVEIVEAWLKEHPIKTRQSEFLKMFPNALIRQDGCIDICPAGVDETFECGDSTGCEKCLNKFWLEEIK